MINEFCCGEWNNGEVCEECECECHAVRCDLVGYSKSKAIRMKDEMHSRSMNKFEHWKCLDCGKWHVSSTGERRMNAKAKNSNPGFAGGETTD